MSHIEEFCEFCISVEHIFDVDVVGVVIVATFSEWLSTAEGRKEKWTAERERQASEWMNT